VLDRKAAGVAECARRGRGEPPEEVAGTIADYVAAVVSKPGKDARSRSSCRTSQASPHNIVIDGEGEGKVVPKGKSDFGADFAAGDYQFYCSVPGHRQAGMEGKLTVK